MSNEVNQRTSPRIYVSTFLLLLVGVMILIPSSLITYDILTPPYVYTHENMIPSLFSGLYTGASILTFTSAYLLLKRKHVGGILGVSSCISIIAITITLPTLITLMGFRYGFSPTLGILFGVGVLSSIISFSIIVIIGTIWSMLKK